MSLNFGRVQSCTYYSFIISRTRVNIDHRLYIHYTHDRNHWRLLQGRGKKKKKKVLTRKLLVALHFLFLLPRENSTQRDFEASDTTDLICQKFLGHDRRLFSRTNASGKRRGGSCRDCRKKSIPHFWGCWLACLCVYLNSKCSRSSRCNSSPYTQDY